MNTSSALNYNPACQALAEASARLGANPLLIQAAGGNTSVKDGDTLWVKASGLWLRDALTRAMFVPVSLSDVRLRVAAGDADPVGPALLKDQAPEGLRPSIETTLHALMPQPVVLHVHAVDAIAWALQPDAQTGLRMPLAGQRWAWVPYHRPGLPLTRAVADIVGEQTVDVLLMANHGLVVGGDTVAEAERRLETVLARLRRVQRPAPLGDGAGLAADGAAAGWRLPHNPRCHAVATDPLNLQRAQRGVMYPDHVVFLGHTVCTAPTGLAGPALADWLDARRHDDPPPPYIAVPGRGVLLREGLSEAAEEMLLCLADVLQRLPTTPEPVMLPADEALALANWEAERFRLQQQR